MLKKRVIVVVVCRQEVKNKRIVYILFTLRHTIITTNDR